MAYVWILADVQKSIKESISMSIGNSIYHLICAKASFPKDPQIINVWSINTWRSFRKKPTGLDMANIFTSRWQFGIIPHINFSQSAKKQKWHFCDHLQSIQSQTKQLCTLWSLWLTDHNNNQCKNCSVYIRVLSFLLQWRKEELMNKRSFVSSKIVATI